MERGLEPGETSQENPLSPDQPQKAQVAQGNRDRSRGLYQAQFCSGMADSSARQTWCLGELSWNLPPQHLQRIAEARILASPLTSC